MRKCLDCGAELLDTDMSCTACNSENLSPIEVQGDNKRLITIVGIVAAIVAVAGIVAGIAYYFLSEYMPAQPVKNGVYAMMSGDLEGCMETMHEELRGTLETLVGTEDFANEYKQSVVSEYTDTYGDNYKLEVKVVDVSSMSDAMVASLNEELEGTIEITDAKYVVLKTKISGEGGAESVSSQTGCSIQVDGKWYFYENLSTGSEEQ